MKLESVSDTGIVEFSSIDNQDGGLIIKRMQDVSPHLDITKHYRNHVSQIVRDQNGEMPWVLGASIPAIVIEQWLQKGVNVYREEDWPKVQQLLNGEYKYLKTIGGRI